MTMRARCKRFTAITTMAFVALTFGETMQKGPRVSREEGEYQVFAAGQEIGTEKYEVVTSLGGQRAHPAQDRGP